MPDHDPDGRSIEAEGFTKAIFDISAVGEVEELLGVTEDNERGRIGGDLGHIVDLESLSPVGRRLNTGHGVVKEVVELTCLDTAGGLGIYLFDKGIDSCAALAGLSRDINYRSIRHISKGGADVVFEFVGGVCILLDRKSVV